MAEVVQFPKGSDVQLTPEQIEEGAKRLQRAIKAGFETANQVVLAGKLGVLNAGPREVIISQIAACVFLEHFMDEEGGLEGAVDRVKDIFDSSVGLLSDFGKHLKEQGLDV